MKPLCQSCSWYQEMAFANGKSVHYCGELGKELPALAVKCRSYADGRKLEFERIGWILEERRRVGFDLPVYEFKKPDKNGQSFP